ncbi:bacillithiol biosynthesis cysteine-adding enzyme BshC [Bacillaceae bacterium SIJ1]|uniref:bacillithiol biosynthesis cysteine-adding enzyme BshC n=1 Tax=Litoribacterium kuwaitense TaxID=1398745 RepID=UPI0013EBB671|nr:bacillithiol biosynthesis cysteine-adding enzyme BshC [Litoribacterium kuwaitense]NGP44352.1 bacillithiol biosynthesis cysteine-adding enzyme BshC [Litoribacterium kuwaitense]
MYVRTTTHIQGNSLLKAYINEEESVCDRFDYNLNDDGMRARLASLQNRDFPRGELADLLHAFNQQLDADETTFRNIERLKDRDAVTVVCGQQAGFLTGPLFTLFKTIRTIQWARTQEMKLGVPVIPVFWIAGEDHDFPEINHLFLPSGDKLQKKALPRHEKVKQSVSDMKLDYQAAEELLQEAFLAYGETPFTKDLYKLAVDELHSSTTYVDFFGRLMAKLFAHEGVVFINAHDPELRKLEAPFFRELLMKNEAVHRHVFHSQEKLVKEGFGKPLDLDRELAHIFVHSKGERFLLERLSDQRFTDRQRTLLYDIDELLVMAENEPDKLSNNVVTRPLMQEYVLPVLTFVAGPGELLYWSVLKDAFHEFGFTLPPIVPRMHATIVDSTARKWMDTYQLTVEDICQEGVDVFRAQREAQLQTDQLGHILQQLSEHYEEMNTLFSSLAAELPDGQTVADAARRQWNKQRTWLEKRFGQSIRKAHQQELAGYPTLETLLFPGKTPQDRVYNGFYWLNRFGVDWIHELIAEPIVNDHYMQQIEL